MLFLYNKEKVHKSERSHVISVEHEKKCDIPPDRLTNRQTKNESERSLAPKKNPLETWGFVESF